jgi:hypothetical protein
MRIAHVRGSGPLVLRLHTDVPAVHGANVFDQLLFSEMVRARQS